MTHMLAKVWKCPDCGSTRWDQNGARALDEAREVGFAQGVEAERLRSLGALPRFPATVAGGNALMKWKRAHPEAPTLADRLKSPTLRAEVAKARAEVERLTREHDEARRQGEEAALRASAAERVAEAAQKLMGDRIIDLELPGGAVARSATRCLCGCDPDAEALLTALADWRKA